MQINLNDDINYFEVFVLYFKNYAQYTFEQFTNFHWSNPVFWVLIWVTFCLLMEAFTKKQMVEYPPFKRKGFWLDMFYVIFYDVFFMVLGFYAFTVVVQIAYTKLLYSFGIEPFMFFSISEIPVVAQIVILFILQDFVEFWAHYFMHRFDFLWAIHKIHHAPEHIGATSARHFHWGEYFIFKPLLYIPFNMIGFTAPQYTYVVLVVFFFEAFFTHANVRTNFGWFNYIINNPETHYWHHAKNVPRRHGVNFASVLNIWDVLIGTYYVPDDKSIRPELGLDDSHEMPQGFIGQFFYPFKYWFQKKKGTNVYESSIAFESESNKVKVTKNKNRANKKTGKVK